MTVALAVLAASHLIAGLGGFSLGRHMRSVTRGRDTDEIEDFSEMASPFGKKPGFFEPVTPKDRFDSSRDIGDFITRN